MLSTTDKIRFLHSVPIFAQAKEQHLADLANGLEEVGIKRDEAVFRQDEEGDSMYIVVSGRIAIERDGTVIATLGPGECFGEMALLDGQPRSASAIAAEDCLLLTMQERDLLKIMTHEIEIARGIFRVLTGRLRDMLKQRSSPDR